MSELNEKRCDTAVPVFQERRRGRPRVEEEMVSISSWIPASRYDQLVRIANMQDKSVSSLVRRFLVLRLPPLEKP